MGRVIGRLISRGAKTPLARLSLIHDKRRLAASVAGVTFAVLLMLIEMGFLFAIYDSSTLWIEAFRADLIMVSRLKDDFNPPNAFPREKLAQADGVEGVAETYPIFMNRLGRWSNRGEARQDLIRVLAFDPSDPVFHDPELDQKRRLLRPLDTALVDRRLRDTYGGLRAGVEGELVSHKVRVVDDFEVGPDLQMNANLLVSDVTFRRVFERQGGQDPLERVEFGLIRLSRGADPTQAAEAIRTRVGPDVRVTTPEGLKREIHWFWTRFQPVGGVFGMGMLVGFGIGLIVCYQVLYTDVIDHLPQLSTLKAIGYPNSFLVRTVVSQGVLLAICALALGLPGAWLTYDLLERVTGLTFRLTAPRAALVASATLLMCCLAGALAVIKALRADPAEVF